MPKLRDFTRALLEDIEQRIDPETEDDFRRQWADFLYHRFPGDIFTPHRRKTSVSRLSHPVIHLNDTLNDREAMLCTQLYAVSDALNSRDKNLAVRANYGTGILPTVFGAELFLMPEAAETQPATRCLKGENAMENLLQKGMPSLSAGLGNRVFETGEYFREVFTQYPKIQKYVEIYHPDLQGPLDVCDLLWGQGLFYEVYDDPDMVLDVMKLITNTYLAFLEKWQSIVPPVGDIHCHWDNLMHRGQLVVRDDTAMNFSPECYETFVRPFDALLMARYGGVIHFCGRGDHYIHLLKEIPGVYGVNLSQPHLNDMETIYRNTVDCGIQLLAFHRETALRDVSRVGGFHGNVHAI